MGVREGELDVAAVLDELAALRPVFHSEADFQHEFALQLKLLFPDCEVRLEVPFSGEARGATDILVRRKGRVHGIELKYLTKKFFYEARGEIFSLKAQGATDLRRYDVMKDILRLERFNESSGGPSFLIVLTNDSAYWNYQPRLNSIDTDFRLHDGRAVTGRLAWGKHAAAGSIKGREQPIELARSYSLSWADYSNVGSGAGRFRSLSVKIA